MGCKDPSEVWVEGMTDIELEAMVAAARRSAETGFPNPGRVGCPDSGSLRAMARGNRQTGSHHVSATHVMQCSPCYGEFMRFRREARVRRIVTVAGAASLATAAAVLAGFYFGPHHTQPTSPQKSTPVAKVAVEARIPLTVDLAQFAVLRGDDSKPAPLPAHLPAKRLRVTFQMPLGFEAGLYRVRLVAQQSVPMMEEKTVRTQFRNGVAFFDLEFEAEGFAGKRVTLLVQPKGLGWRKYPLIVDGLPPPEGGSTSVEKKE